MRVINLTALLRTEAPAADDPRYGHRRAGVDRPVVVWTATRRCNLSCTHCYTASSDRAYPGELSTEEAGAFIDDLARMGVTGLLVSGGEPLSRPDVLDMCRRASDGGVNTTLSTNGTFLADAAVADGVAAAGFRYVGVSFDGLGETHDHFRGQQGAFAASLRGVRNLRERGIRVGLRMTLTASTIPALDDVFNFVVAEGFGRACFYHLAPAGRGRSAREEVLTPEASREAVDRIIAFADTMREQRPDLEVLTVANAADGPRLLGWLDEHGRPTELVRLRLRLQGGNRSGVALAHVSNTGDVHPDQFSWGDRLGNVHERAFSDIWSTSAGLLEQLRDRHTYLQGRCADCRHVDVCGGNLRMRAQASGTGRWETDPGCYLLDSETFA